MYRSVIEKYIPKNEQEVVDKEAILSFINKNTDVLSRDNLIAHLTTSAFIVNKEMTRVVFAYHLIYESWAWIGGHNDNEPDCLKVAIQETNEGLEVEKEVEDAKSKKTIMICAGVFAVSTLITVMGYRFRARSSSAE